jgi:5-hydroxyisourate hydrolase
MTVSTHVLDAARGRPAQGVPVRLEAADGTVLADAVTDSDGRAGELAAAVAPGVYRLRFDIAAYDADSFYPDITVSFRITDGAARHHVPVLLSPHAYTTYRGS